MNAPRLALFAIFVLGAVAAALWFEPWAREAKSTTISHDRESVDDAPIAHADSRPIERATPEVTSEPDEANGAKPTSDAWIGVLVEREGLPSVGARVRIGRLARVTDDRGIVEFDRREVLDEPDVMLRGEILCIAGAGTASARRTFPIGPARVRMQLREDGGNFVRGEVVDMQQRPIAGATVRFGASNPGLEQLAVTDEKGAFEFGALLAEPALLEVEIAGIVRERRAVSVPSRQRIEIADPTALTIHVQGNAAGETVEVAVVVLGGEGPSFIAWRESSNAASPIFHSEALSSRSTFAVCVAADGFAPIYREVPTPTSQTMTVVLERKNPLRLHLPGCAGKSVNVTATSDVDLESARRTNATFTVSEQVELDATGTAVLRRVARDRIVRFQASVPVERGQPGCLRFLGGVLDPTKNLEATFPEIVLHPIRLRVADQTKPFLLDFEFAPPPHVRVPNPPEYSTGYGVFGSHHVASDEAGEIVLDWPPGRTFTAELRVSGENSRAVEFEVRGPGEVLLREAAPR